VLECGIKVIPKYFLPPYANDEKCFAVVQQSQEQRPTVYMRNTITGRYSFLVRLSE
jgi:hypothetical protein